MALKENTGLEHMREGERGGGESRQKTSSDDEQRRPIGWAACRNGQSLASRKHRADPSCRLYSMQRRTVK
jgi:hypothetical protein